MAVAAADCHSSGRRTRRNKRGDWVFNCLSTALALASTAVASEEHSVPLSALTPRQTFFTPSFFFPAVPFFSGEVPFSLRAAWQPFRL